MDILQTTDYKIFYDVEQLGANFNAYPIPLSIIYLLAEGSDENIYSEQLSSAQGVFELLTHSYYASELIKDNPHIFETYINLVTIEFAHLIEKVQ